jgi:hypothetical protein
VYPPALDAGNLRARFDVLVFADGGIPERDGGARGRVAQLAALAPEFARQFQGPDPASIPEEFRGRLGSVTVAKTVPALKKFVEEGGVLVAMGSSSIVGRHFELPIGNALVERTAAGERELPREKFFIPGSVLRVAVDVAHPLAHGMPATADVFFDNSPVFSLGPSAAMKGVRAVAWFDSPAPLRSGWAWGQHYLEGGVVAVEAPLGRGKVFLFGPEVTFRSQPHGTFKLLFNGIYYGAASAAAAGARTTTESGR